MTTKNAYSGFLLKFEPARTLKIFRFLDLSYKTSESFSAIDWDLAHREVAMLVSNPGAINVGALVLMEKMVGNGGTGRQKMEFKMCILFEKPILAEEFGQDLDIKKLVSSADQMNRIVHSDWIRLVEALKLARPEHAEDIEKLLAERDVVRKLVGDDPRTLRLMEQRDAIGLAVDVAGLDRKTIIKNVRIEKVAGAQSILDLLDHEPFHEQDLIRHDQEIFKNLLVSDMRAMRFSGKEGREVRVYVYDKKPLETVLGTDLLIYQEGYKSFLLLQYKTMENSDEEDGGGWSYLVDMQIHKQIQAMQDAESVIKCRAEDRAAINDWRLNSSGFYFKFCETSRSNAREDALVPGITLGIEHLVKFLSLPDSDGDFGGKRVGYSNCPRYLNNTQFLDLAKSGWIGCDANGYKFISEVLSAGREGGKTAMYAVIQGSTPKQASARRGRRG